MRVIDHIRGGQNIAREKPIPQTLLERPYPSFYAHNEDLINRFDLSEIAVIIARVRV